MLGRESTVLERLPESETLAVSDGAGLLWPENAQKQEKAEKSEKQAKPLL